MGDHAKVYDPIVAILNYRLSGKRVREIIELIYVNECSSLGERLAYAKNKKDNPYPAQFEGNFEGRITCGHNPFLYARLVDDLRVEVDENGEEKLKWKERTRLPRRRGRAFDLPKK